MNADKNFEASERLNRPVFEFAKGIDRLNPNHGRSKPKLNPLLSLSW